MRNFLLDKKIVGALMVSRCGNILDYTIPEMMRWVDYLIIMLDFPDQKTIDIVEKYKKIYPIETFNSDVPDYIGEKDKTFFEKTEQGMFRRFNTLQGEIREKMLDHIKGRLKGGEKIDILVWLDSDEILCNSMEQVLIDFANNPKKKGLILRSAEVFNDFYHITPARMNCHLRIIKPALDQKVLPYRGLAQIWGITKPMKERVELCYVHAYMLTKEKREWRAKHWRGRDFKTYCEVPLWRTEKGAIELSPEEIRDIFKKEPDLTIGEYLKINNLEI